LQASGQHRAAKIGRISLPLRSGAAPDRAWLADSAARFRTRL